MRELDRRTMITGGLATAAALTSVRRAGAQALPQRTLRLLVPFPAGGPSDVLVRIVAEEMKALHAAGVIVENKPGGAGTIATRAALQAPADGTTILIGNNQTHVTAPHLIKDAGYDPLKDFTPVAQIAEWPHVLVVRKDLVSGGVAELIAKAKATSGRLTFGSTGPGSGSHLAAEMLMLRAGMTMQHVPYQSAAQLVGDIAAGRLDLALGISSSVLAAVGSGQVQALAIAAANRSPSFASVPTLAEAGVKDAEATSWLATFVHAGTEQSLAGGIEALLAEAFRRLAARAADHQRAKDLGLLAAPVPSVDFRKVLLAEQQRWLAVIQHVGLKPE